MDTIARFVTHFESLLASECADDYVLRNHRISKHTMVDAKVITYAFNNRLVLDISEEETECSLVGRGFACVYQYDSDDVESVAELVISQIKGFFV